MKKTKTTENPIIATSRKATGEMRDQTQVSDPRNKEESMRIWHRYRTHNKPLQINEMVNLLIYFLIDKILL